MTAPKDSIHAELHAIAHADWEQHYLTSDGELRRRCCGRQWSWVRAMQSWPLVRDCLHHDWHKAQGAIRARIHHLALVEVAEEERAALFGHLATSLATLAGKVATGESFMFATAEVVAMDIHAIWAAHHAGKPAAAVDLPHLEDDDGGSGSAQGDSIRHRHRNPSPERCDRATSPIHYTPLLADQATSPGPSLAASPAPSDLTSSCHVSPARAGAVSILDEEECEEMLDALEGSTPGAPPGEGMADDVEEAGAIAVGEEVAPPPQVEEEEMADEVEEGVPPPPAEELDAQSNEGEPPLGIIDAESGALPPGATEEWPEDSFVGLFDPQADGESSPPGIFEADLGALPPGAMEGWPEGFALGPQANAMGFNPYLVGDFAALTLVEGDAPYMLPDLYGQEDA